MAQDVDEIESSNNPVAALTMQTDILVRYHIERKDFFEALSKISNLLIVILGMTATAGFFSSLWGQGNLYFDFAPFLTATIAAFNLVMDPSSFAAKHAVTAKSYLKIKKEIDFIDDDKAVGSLVKQFHEVRIDNPPVYHVLFLYCNNVKNVNNFADAWVFDIPTARKVFKNIFKQSDWVPGRPKVYQFSPESDT